MAFMKTGAPEKQKPVIDEGIDEDADMFYEDDDVAEQEPDEEADTG